MPVARILEKADALFDKNDYVSAGRLLENWESEAVALRDKRGELSIVSELMGFYRKVGDKEKGLKSVGTRPGTRQRAPTSPLGRPRRPCC